MSIRPIILAGLTVLLAACGAGGDPSSPDPPVTPPPPGGPGSAHVEPLPADATSRRLDLAIAVPDSGGGVASVEIHGRPAGGAFALLATAAGPRVRVTLPADGPFGVWEFAAMAVAADGTREGGDLAAEATTVVPEPITLTDRHGEVWEITHAVLRYGLSVRHWGHGIGRHGIRPVIDPDMACPGEPGYLDADNLSVVFGVEAGGEARAYRLGDMNDREVVDDTIGGAHLAVTY